MGIGELSRRVGVSQRLLRYYEEQGLVRPRRRPSGYRQYDESDVLRVRNIRTLLAAGLGTSTIAEVLPCMVDDGSGLAPACSGLVEELHRERDRMSHAIAELQQARNLLDAIVEAAPPSEEDPALACTGSNPPEEPAVP